MKHAVKHLSVDKGDVRYEIHKVGCSDNYKNNPLGVYVVEGTPEEIIERDVVLDITRKEYEVMPCAK